MPEARSVRVALRSVAVLLDRMGGWVRGENEPPYPLAQACHDHRLGLAIEEAATGEPVDVDADAWCWAPLIHLAGATSLHYFIKLLNLVG